MPHLPVWSLKWFLQNAAPIGTYVGLICGIIAAAVALREYRLKAEAERRETDVRVTKLFVEPMWLAHARAGCTVSEKCVEELFERGIIKPGDCLEQINSELQTACVLNHPVGVASQDSAILAVGMLGHKYEILREPARAGLKGLRNAREQAVTEALRILDGVHV
jgi:hypothetical protein